MKAIVLIPLHVDLEIPTVKIYSLKIFAYVFTNI